MSDIKLTERQRSMLCYLEAHEGDIPRGEGIGKHNPDLALELRLSLQNLGLVEKETWVDGSGWRYPVTEKGREQALAYRYSSSGCPACVQAFCVCRVRIVCVAGCDRAGCHGSHD